MPTKPLIKWMMLALMLVCAGALLAYGHDIRPILQHPLELLRTAGPVPFFLAMALLPAVGAPILFFSLAAGSVFGPQLGMPLVIALSIMAITANMIFSYALAHRILRPLLEHMFTRMGYRLPKLETSGFTELIVLVRVTPGIPFPVQNYLLSMAAIPFLRYLLVSSVVVLPFNAAIIFFGEALLEGNARIALLSFLVMIALAAAIQLVRQHYGKKRAPPVKTYENST